MASRRKLVWQLYPSYILISVLAIIAVTWYSTWTVRAFFLEQMRADLEMRAHLVERYVSDKLEPGDRHSIQRLCRELGGSESSRLTVILTSGEVIADSAEDPEEMDDHSRRPEVIQAMKGNIGTSVRYSVTLGREMRYVAVPVKTDGEIKAVVRASVASTAVDDMLRYIHTRIGFGAVAAAFLAALVSMFVSKRIGRPLEEIEMGASRLAGGDLGYRLSSYNAEEINAVANALNRMAVRVEQQLTARRDFVGNVSHELRTPITSIKGFVETLLDGAIEDPEQARNFLGIIDRQTDRLNAIVDDLLALSRIEQESEQGEIALEECTLRDILEAAAENCQVQADSKDVGIDIQCNLNIKHKVNFRLLEHAVTNLIDNAVKYSDEGGKVSVKCDENNSRMTISVGDEGPGIPEEHLSRIFERFYRVDKARSRKMGGTGLGLAIVKHIAQDHRGSVSVKSEPGKGSVFTLDLPVSK